MSSTKKSLVVVGNGMASYKLCELLRDSRDGDRYRVTVFGDEPRPAYDRVHLTSYFGGASADDLLLAPRSWYAKRDIDLRVGDRVVAIDRDNCRLRSSSGGECGYDELVLATGSAPFVPPIPGHDLEGVFVYRTIEDLDAIRNYAHGRETAAVLGGGLLGLEAAKALADLGLETHVVEAAPGLMSRQLDSTGSRMLATSIRNMGVRVHVRRRTSKIVDLKSKLLLRFEDDEDLAVDMIVISAGIRPRDELARDAGLALGERGGIAVDDYLHTSDPAISAVGECASHNGFVYGLVAPCYQMADTLAARLTGHDKPFRGADLSTKLKLMGVDVASVGDSTAVDGPETTSVAMRDDLSGVYKKLIVNQQTGALRGAVLVGDAANYNQIVGLYRSGQALPAAPVSLIVDGADTAATGGVEALADDALICTCNNVSKGAIRCAVRDGITNFAELKGATKAMTGCGGCSPDVKKLFELTLAESGVEVRKSICEHFPFSREELFQIVKIEGWRTFAEVMGGRGSGRVGCEVCKPAVASILASLYAEPAVAHQAIQDTNDRFLANIQRGGTYSVVPRIPGGEITPDKLIVLGQVAKDYDLYLKITGGQRIDLFGARVDQLPDIWQTLVEAGFESGHAYAKGMRTVKSCVGSTWCRFGQLDSVGFAIRVEHRYKGLRAPHKLKSAVSGCIRECAEARCKDFGIIATSEGWNLYVCGNGGANPRHGDLLAAGLDDDTCLRYIDRFLLYYIHTADPLMRTARWLEALDGGIDYLRSVVIDDHLGICAELDRQMDALAAAYQCEWAAVVRDPEKRRRFRAFVNTSAPDTSISFVPERDQKRPASGGGRLALEEMAHA